jgi:hypothetical protein
MQENIARLGERAEHIDAKPSAFSTTRGAPNTVRLRKKIAR